MIETLLRRHCGGRRLKAVVRARLKHSLEICSKDELLGLSDREYRALDQASIPTREDWVRAYPRIIAHIICESLGYATPDVAAVILADAHYGQPNWCEWIHACYGTKAVEAVKDAIRRRHQHKGYMAEYENAVIIVRRQLEMNRKPELASWF